MASVLARFSFRRDRLPNPIPSGGGELIQVRKTSNYCISRSSKSSMSSKRVPGHGGKKADVEKLWRELFADTTKWRDHRFLKVNPRFPDFTHITMTHKELWANSELNPPWVKARLVAILPCAIKSSTLSWKQWLLRCAQAGQYERTMELFLEMQAIGISVDKSTLFPVLKACACLRVLEHCRRVHIEIRRLGYEADLFLGNSLVDMYAKCGSIEDAERVFDQMPTRNVVTWNAMILGCVRCGEGRKALDIFEQMPLEGSGAPDALTFVGFLKACTIVGALEKGRRAHGDIIRRGFMADVNVGSCLVDMYAKCGSIKEAERVFNQMPQKNIAAWTAMVLGYAQCGEGESMEKAERVFNEMPNRNVVVCTAMIEGYVKCRKGHKALKLFDQMNQNGVVPTRSTFVGVLNACASVTALEEGRRVHGEITRRGYESDAALGSCLVDMYAKCGSVEEVERVLKQRSTTDVVT